MDIQYRTGCAPRKFYWPSRATVIALAVAMLVSPARGEFLFVDCTDEQRDTIRYAYALAFGRAKAAEDRVAATPSYERWFGNWSEARGNRVLREIGDIISTALIGTPKFNCMPRSAVLCSDGQRFAYVRKETSYDVSICPAFWVIDPNDGYDMTSILLHEIAHFEIGVGGMTVDHCQGFGGTHACADLARNAPDQAVENADNYRLFIEDGGRLDGEVWGMIPPPGYR